MEQELDFPTPFEITDQDGVKTAVNAQGNRLTVLEDLEGTKVWRRRAVKGFGSANAQQVEWTFALLPDGTRVYFDGNSVVVTKRDLYP